MSETKTKPDRHTALRLSNEESNRITRESIEIAFIALLSEKDMEQITLSEVARRAGVSRSALYRNYPSKDAILEAVFHTILDYTREFTRLILSQDHPRSAYRGIFEKIQEDAWLFRLMIKAGVPEKNFVNMKDLIARLYPDAGGPVRHILLGWAGMLLSILLDWFMDGMTEEIDAMVELCVSLSSDVLTRMERLQPGFLEQHPAGAAGGSAATKNAGSVHAEGQSIDLERVKPV